MKRRTLLQQTSALGLLGLLTACGGGSDPAPQDDKHTTLLVYLVASDLLDGRGAERDLVNMLKARNSAQVNVVLQIGGGKTAGEFPGIDMQQTRRYRLVPRAGAADGWTLEALPEAQQPRQVPMNQPDTLQDFVQWAAREYPARQYALSLWDHGGGPIHGFGNDMALGAGKALSLADITSALQRAAVHFELIGFDCCLMASLEVANGLAPYSRYMVGSEEVTTGWDWTQVVDFVATHPQGKGDALGRAIVDSYKAFDGTGPLDFTAYSVSDLGKSAALMQVFDQVAATLKGAIETQGLQAWWAIAVARREAQDFQSNVFQTHMDLVDVKSFIHELGEVDMLPAALVDRFNAAFAALVVHADGSEDEAGGLMMYFPRYSTLDAKLLALYRATQFSPAYHALVDTYTAFAVSDDMPYIAVGAPRIEANALVADVSVVPRPTYKRALPVLSRPFDQAFGALVRNGVALSLQTATAAGQQVRLEDFQLWPMVQGQLVTLLLEDEEDDDLFQIPAARVDTEDDDDLDPGMLMAMRGEDGQVRIRWFVSNSVLAGSTASMLEVEPGEQYVPMGLELATSRWTITSDDALEVPQGDWLLTRQTPTQQGFELRLVASDLTGVLRSSPSGTAL